MIGTTNHSTNPRRTAPLGTRIPPRLFTDPRPPAATLKTMLQQSEEHAKQVRDSKPLIKLEKHYWAELLRTKGVINSVTQEKIEDTRTLLTTRNLKSPHSQNLLSLSVIDRPNGPTDFFLSTDSVKNLPKDIAAKIDDDDLNEGIHFMVPQIAIPVRGLQNKEHLIKKWLELPQDSVDFHLYPSPKRKK